MYNVVTTLAVLVPLHYIFPYILTMMERKKNQTSTSIQLKFSKNSNISQLVKQLSQQEYLDQSLYNVILADFKFSRRSTDVNHQQTLGWISLKAVDEPPPAG